MGLREKVVLIVIVVTVLQTTHAFQTSRSATDNPFDRYSCKSSKKKLLNRSIGNALPIKNGNINPRKDPSIFLQKYDKDAIKSNAKSSGDDMQLLNKLRKEAKIKRKLNYNQIKDGTNDALLGQSVVENKPQSLLGNFPEVEYPLNAADTWSPKYWNFMPNMDEDFKSKNSLYQTLEKEQKNSGFYIRPSRLKNNRGLFATVGKAKEKNNFNKTTATKKAKTVAENIISPFSSIQKEIRNNQTNLKIQEISSQIKQELNQILCATGGNGPSVDYIVDKNNSKEKYLPSVNKFPTILKDDQATDKVSQTQDLKNNTDLDHKNDVNSINPLSSYIHNMTASTKSDVDNNQDVSQSDLNTKIQSNSFPENPVQKNDSVVSNVPAFPLNSYAETSKIPEQYFGNEVANDRLEDRDCQKTFQLAPSYYLKPGFQLIDLGPLPTDFELPFLLIPNICTKDSKRVQPRTKTDGFDSMEIEEAISDSQKLDKLIDKILNGVTNMMMKKINDSSKEVLSHNTASNMTKSEIIESSPDINMNNSVVISNLPEKKTNECQILEMPVSGTPCTGKSYMDKSNLNENISLNDIIYGTKLMIDVNDKFTTKSTYSQNDQCIDCDYLKCIDTSESDSGKISRDGLCDFYDYRQNQPLTKPISKTTSGKKNILDIITEKILKLLDSSDSSNVSDKNFATDLTLRSITEQSFDNLTEILKTDKSNSYFTTLPTIKCLIDNTETDAFIKCSTTGTIINDTLTDNWNTHTPIKLSNSNKLSNLSITPLSEQFDKIINTIYSLVSKAATETMINKPATNKPSDNSLKGNTGTDMLENTPDTLVHELTPDTLKGTFTKEVSTGTSVSPALKLHHEQFRSGPITLTPTENSQVEPEQYFEKVRDTLKNSSVTDNSVLSNDFEDPTKFSFPGQDFSDLPNNDFVTEMPIDDPVNLLVEGPSELLVPEENFKEMVETPENYTATKIRRDNLIHDALIDQFNQWDEQPIAKPTRKPNNELSSDAFDSNTLTKLNYFTTDNVRDAPDEDSFLRDEQLILV